MKRKIREMESITEGVGGDGLFYILWPGRCLSYMVSKSKNVLSSNLRNYFVIKLYTELIVILNISYLWLMGLEKV